MSYKINKVIKKGLCFTLPFFMEGEAISYLINEIVEFILTLTKAQIKIGARKDVKTKGEKNLR